MHEEQPRQPWGLMAQFDSPAAIVEAARRARDVGFTKVDAYSPYPLHQLDEALRLPRTKLPWLVLAGGITGTIGGLGLQYWASVIEYPMNIGGRPFASWVSFIVPAYETTILFAAGAAVLGMLALNGLPEPYHPVFNVPAFALATRDKFFICVEARDPLFDAARTRSFLEELPQVSGVYEVEH